MRSVVVVQARTGSTRLPGKVLADLVGRPMLARQLQRVVRTPGIDDVVVATSNAPADDPIIEIADSEGVRWFRGDELDVLARMLGAAQDARADVVVRVTADCPLVDPTIAGAVLTRLLEEPGGADYASNVQRRTYPRGLDVEAMHVDVLVRSARLGSSKPAREHVTFFVTDERPDLFVQVGIEDREDNSDLRWTVDVPEDLELVRSIYEELDVVAADPAYSELLRLVRARPHLVRRNAHVVQKTI